MQGVGAAVGGLGFGVSGYANLIPYIEQPDDIVPGVSTWFATSCRECPAGCGMVVRNRESRTIKCEGNPQHPINRGTLCSRGQAALNALYDPDRVTGPMRRRKSGKFVRESWDDALDAVGDILARRGRIAFVSDLQTGSLDVLMRRWASAFGSDRFIVYEPINYESVKAVNGGVVPSFDIAATDYLISFSADFLETWISPVEFANGFRAIRDVKDGTRPGFAYIGPRVSMTAASADVRLIVPPGAELEVATAIRTGEVDAVARKYDLNPQAIRRVAEGLAAARAPLALPGWSIESARAAASIGSTLIDRGRPHAVTNIASKSEMLDLVSDMENGAVDVLVVFGTNLIYSLPESARFADALKRVPTVISLSSFFDETTMQADWILPSNTPLESWGDYAPYPDVANLMQPTMGTVFDTRQTGDILIDMAEAAGLAPKTVFNAESYYEFLRRRWGTPLPPDQGADASAPQWEAILQRGGQWPGATGAGDSTPATGYESLGQAIPFSLTAVTTPAVVPPSPVSAAAVTPAAPTAGTETRGMHLYAYPHIYMYDGRGANRRWLQEMPEPVTQALWGTWAELHPKTADELGIKTDDVIEITYNDTKIQIPAYVWNGVAPNTVAVPIGEGHRDYGQYAKGTGANILTLLEFENPMVRVRSTGKSRWAARVKGSTDENGRDIVQTALLGEPFKRDVEVDLPLPEGYKWDDFYPGHEHTGHRWAMVVDLNRCIGCHACVTACYAENNIGIVGADGILRRREMAWLRIDPYIDWDRSSAPILFQPMLCQHCDAAPCETVCPVYASAHNEEGVNMQVYNRCVGTRYCSNNCPYKVRRFNWFDYKWPKPLNWQLNPDVTVRSRGVMEKCTFCIQRIRQAEIVAKREGRPVRDGEVTPACAQTCPTGVYTFGDLMDPDSRVSKLIRNDPRAYQVLHELNTKSAVIYLKRVIEKA